MSVTVRAIKGNKSLKQASVSVHPIRPIRFTDWNGGETIEDDDDQQQNDLQTDVATMQRGNETVIGFPGGECDEIYDIPKCSYAISGKNKLERLRDNNRDVWWKYREDTNISKNADSEFKMHMLVAFACELGLNSYQRQRALRRFMKLDLRRGTGRGATNAFIICSLVANKEAEKHDSEKIYHPQRSSDSNDDSFERLQNALMERFPKITTSGLTKLYNKHSQGNPPTRHKSKWETAVKQESSIPQRPFAPEQVIKQDSSTQQRASFSLEQCDRT